MADAIVGFIFDLIFEGVIAGTGSVILSVFSLDSSEDVDSSEADGKLLIFLELNFWVGAAFWVAVGGLLYWYFTR